MGRMVTLVRSVRARPAQTQGLDTNMNVLQTVRTVVWNHPYRGGNLATEALKLTCSVSSSSGSRAASHSANFRLAALVAAASSLTSSPLWASLAVHVHICLSVSPSMPTFPIGSASLQNFTTLAT